MRLTHVRFYGNEPFQIAVVHGGPGAPGTVAAVARELSSDYGIMEPIQTRTTIHGQVAELRDVVEHFGELPVTLIGHSWGAWLVYIFAATYTSCVRKLILVASAPFEEKYVSDLTRNRLNHLSDEERKEILALQARLNTSSTKDKSRHLSRLLELLCKSDTYQGIRLETDDADVFPVEAEIFEPIWTEASCLRKDGTLLKIGAR